MRSGIVGNDDGVDTLKDEQRALVYALIAVFLKTIYYHTLLYVVHQDLPLEDASDAPMEIVQMAIKREILSTTSKMLENMKVIYNASIMGEFVSQAKYEEEEYVELAQEVLDKTQQYTQLLDDPDFNSIVMLQTVHEACTRISQEYPEEEEGEYDSDETDEEEEERSTSQDEFVCSCDVCTEMRSQTELWEHWIPEPYSLEEMLWKATEANFKK